MKRLALVAALPIVAPLWAILLGLIGALAGLGGLWRIVSDLWRAP